jgi:signal transduction histidine kinase
LMSSLTATLAILLTVNMIIERREFLEMLSEIETSRSTLNHEIKTGLDAIQRFSNQLKDVERSELDDVRRIAADISRTADKLDRAVEGILSADDEDGPSVGLAAHIPLGLNAASWRPATPATELSPKP